MAAFSLAMVVGGVPVHLRCPIKTGRARSRINFAPESYRVKKVNNDWDVFVRQISLLQGILKGDIYIEMGRDYSDIFQS